ncbi:hypothetical protein FRZ54_02210 [Mucilaginibacter ginsenosidivorans]|uniref:Uncharacterized protein n=1 Tax=Mucilaginibacter ginsenosidivorans TaxID=398053 RepID=A0A5B8UQY7_9SPHI|nr:hypothetical protein [Mucilaginibacter ginsenosidivorans]QEC61444.1 hypothetical protein FRZ54_02210 [Mucilaginibacter ginsenosidivorans]
MKLLIILFALAVAQIASAQVKPVPLDKKALPKTIHYDGHIVNAVKYTDNEGDHVVIATETGEVEVKEDGESFAKADVYAYNYVMNGGKPTLAWQMHDFTIICPLTRRLNMCLVLLRLLTSTKTVRPKSG